MPRELVVLGMQPEIVELGWELSTTIQMQLGTLVAAMVSELERWGVSVADGMEDGVLMGQRERIDEE
jgi:hypothetical protein